MGPPTFVQESRLGRVIFQIREGLLFVSVARTGGGFAEYQVDLRGVNPAYRARVVRLNAQLVLMALLFVVCALAIWGAHHQTVIPRGALEYFLHWPYIGLVTSIILGVQYARRVEYFRFYDHDGTPVVDIAREPAQAVECETFVLALVAHVELAQSNLSARERETMLRRLVRDYAPLPRLNQSVPFWKFSLALGALAVGLPWIPGLSYYLDVFGFLLLFTLCVGGAAGCVFSYQKKESGRHWSLLGLMLSLIPPFLY